MITYWVFVIYIGAHGTITQKFNSEEVCREFYTRTVHNYLNDPDFKRFEIRTEPCHEVVVK